VNFDTVRFDYYRDANAAFEAFKKGDADIRTEGDPVRGPQGMISRGEGRQGNVGKNRAALASTHQWPCFQYAAQDI